MNTKQIAEEAAAEWYDPKEQSGLYEQLKQDFIAAIEKAVRACTCIPDDEHDCPVHVPNRGQQQPKAEPRSEAARRYFLRPNTTLL